MTKDLNGFLKSFAGNLGQQMGGMSGMPQDNPFLKLFGKSGVPQVNSGDESELNPGQKMFGMNKNNESFISRFGTNLSDQLFQRAMMGFMGNGPR